MSHGSSRREDVEVRGIERNHRDASLKLTRILRARLRCTYKFRLGSRVSADKKFNATARSTCILVESSGGRVIDRRLDRASSSVRFDCSRAIVFTNYRNFLSFLADGLRARILKSRSYKHTHTWHAT